MPILQAEDIADLIASTQKDLGRLKITDAAAALQDYTFANMFVREGAQIYSGGTGVQWNVMVKHSGAAHQTGLYATESVDVKDVIKQGSATWKHTRTAYAIDRKEISMNAAGPERIIDLVTVRRNDAMISLAEKLETLGWAVSGSADGDDPLGIFNYIIYDNSATAGSLDLNDDIPTGFTNVAGISPATYSRWRNWSGKYSSIDNSSASTNAMTLIRQAIRKSKFKGVSAAQMQQYGGDMKRGIYANSDTLDLVEFVLANQNDNLGNDALPKFDVATINRVPVTYAPYLDYCNQNPIVGIDWSTFKVAILEGENMFEQNHKPESGQPSVFKTFVDLSWNTACFDRRKQWIVSDSASALSFSAIPEN